VVRNHSKDSVIIFDHKSKYIKSKEPGFQKEAHGCLLGKEGGTEYLYLSDYERHVVVGSTLDGETVWTLNWPKDSGVYEKLSNTVVAPNGDIYVADGYGLSYVHQFSPRLERIRPWAGKGSEAGKPDCSHGIWIDTRGAEPIVVVADRSNARLHTFTLHGKHVGFIRAPSAVSATISVCGKPKAGRICLTLPGCLASSSGCTLPAEISAATSMRWSDSGGACHEAEEGVGGSGFQELSK